jgi:cell volume regulation protein A
VLLTAGLVAAFAVVALGVPPAEGFLLGAIISSTDAAAVFAVMRSRGVSLKPPLKPLIEFESGSNDPMAVFLTVGMIGYLTAPDASLAALVPAFVLQMGLGALGGFAFGKLVPVVINRLRLEYEGLYPVFTLGTVMLTYSATALAGGNGFLAVYVAGVVLAGSDFLHKRSLNRYHDGLAWLMQITMFVVLGLLVYPSRLPTVAGSGLLVSAFLILVARPLAVFAILGFTGLGWRKKAMVAWVGLRGSVPIILATFPFVAGVPDAELLFSLVFFIVLTSVVIQGTSIPLVARLLRVDAPLRERVGYPIEFTPSGDFKSDLVEVRIEPGSTLAGRTIVESAIPTGALIVIVNRGKDFIVPRGGTVLEPDDTLLMFADPRSREAVEALAAGREEG